MCVCVCLSGGVVPNGEERVEGKTGGDGTLLGLVLLLCNHGNRQGKSGHSLPRSARGKKNVKGGEGREPHVITPVMPSLLSLLRGQTARRMSSKGRVWK